MLLGWNRPEGSPVVNQIIVPKNIHVLVLRPVLLVLDGRRDLQM